MALVGLTVTLAPTIGPTVGGYLTELFSWHWLFLVNVIPGIAATLLAWSLVDFDKPDFSLLRALRLRRPRRRWRSSSAASSTCSRRGRRTTGSTTAASSCSPSLGVIAGVVFFWRTLTARTPIVDLTRLHRPQLRGRLAADLRARHRPLRPHLPLSALPRAGPRLHRRSQIGETVFVTGAFMFLTAPVVGIAGAQDRPAPADLRRPRALRLLELRPDADHRRLGLRRAVPAAGDARRGADVLHDPDQHDRARHAAAASGSRTPRASST